MATNVCSRSRRKFIKVKTFAEQYDMSEKTVYKMIKNNPIFEPAIMKIGEKGVRVDQDMMFDIMQQYYR